MLKLDRLVCRLFLALLISCATSCAGKKDNPELDSLQRPPQIVNYPAPEQDRAAYSEPEVEDAALEEVEKQPNQNVQLTNVAGSNTAIKILEPFDEAWLLVTKALKYDSAFKITDRNRDQGVFYVSYNPDDHDNTFWNNTVSFLSGGSESEGSYNLRLVESGPNTDLSAEMIVEEEFDDEGDSFADPEVGVEKFLSALYKVLQEI